MINFHQHQTMHLQERGLSTQSVRLFLPGSSRHHGRPDDEPVKTSTLSPYLGWKFLLRTQADSIHSLRNNSFDAIETQISETVDNKLTQFDDGATIVTLHLRRRR